MEFGTITFFDGRDDKRFGFIEADRDGEKIFFHLNNELMVMHSHDGNYGGKDPEWHQYKFDHDHAIKHGQIPRKGERIIFERGDSPKGPKALKWSKDYDIESEIHPYHGPAHIHTTLLRMTVTWDIVEITFTNKDFLADTLFGDMEARTREFLKLEGLMGLDEELLDSRYHCGVSKWGSWGDKRTFRFKVYNNIDHRRLIDLSVGRGIVEDVKYDDLTRIRHARHWDLEDTASLEDIVRAYDDYIDRLTD
jgi:cold shock CspA family protein